MIPRHLHRLFWDVNLDNFNPADYPRYTISHILELGDDDAVQWMRATFSEADIRNVIMTDRTLSQKSAHYWALVYGMSPTDVAALHPAS